MVESFLVDLETGEAMVMNLDIMYSMNFVLKFCFSSFTEVFRPLREQLNTIISNQSLTAVICYRV